MARYTVQLRTIVESGFDLGLQNYPIFDDSYRKGLNDKIIEHYYFQEIGQETAGLFKRFLNRKMNEIMPYYNQLYRTTLIEFDPLATKNMKEVLTRLQVGSANATNEAQGNNKDRKVYSETPQSMLSMEDIENDVYATTADINQNEGTSSSSASSQNQNNEDVERIVSGYEGVASELIMKYRSSILNIDMMIIKELDSLFMGIW